VREASALIFFIYVGGLPITINWLFKVLFADDAGVATARAEVVFSKLHER
jgi:hypothetical protein